MPLDEVEDKLNKETEKSRIIREKLLEQEQSTEGINKDFRDRCVPALEPIFTEMLSAEQNRIDNVVTNGQSSEESSENRVKKIRDLLKRGEFDALANYLIELDRFNIEKRNALPIEEQVIYFMVLVNSYLFDDYVS